jgi:hypothetical protein
MRRFTRRIVSRALPFAAIAALALAPLSRATAQSSQRGQPKTPFATADFDKLKWLEGAWEGTSPGERTFYERIHFTSDSTVDITYYTDSTLARETGSGRVYLSVGRIYHSFGPARWGASHVDTANVYFIPQVNAHNTFAWSYQSPDAWTATLRTGFSGHERVTVYQMRRIRPR